MQTKGLFIGYFFQENDKLWQAIGNLCLEYPHIIYIIDEHPSNIIKAVLEDSNFEILTTSEIYLREQVVRAIPVIKALEQKITEKAIVFIEMTWAVRSPSGDIYLRELQASFQQFLYQHPNLTIVCIYNESILLEEQLLLGLFSHPLILTEKGFSQNHYYLPPHIVKKNQAKLRFNYWLSNIDSQRDKPLVDAIKQGNVENKEDFPLERTFNTMIAQTNEGRWKIRCLGELKIRRENGEIIDWNTKTGSTRKLKAIFAFLLLRGERGATLEELSDFLWAEANSTEQALNRLYHAIRHLRLILEPNMTKKSSFIIHQGTHYYLKMPYDSWIDLPMFQELCFKGNQHLQEKSWEQCKICYEAAERLYSGELFMDIPLKYIENTENDWCWSKRTWYHEMYQKLLYSLANIHRQLGNFATSISYCDKALLISPNLEEAHKEKILTLAASQRIDALHRQYRIYCESLKKFNMGMPSPTMKNLYLSLLSKKHN
jgi:DNA-binding SARP family transcriptional activator